MPRTTLLPAILSASLALAAGPAAAQGALDRLETLDERMNALVFDALETQIPALSGYRPALEWDAAMRENGACLLGRVEAASGDEGVAQLLSSYEATLEAAGQSGADLGGIRIDPPGGMTTEAFQSAYAECGMLDWLSTRLAESGALAVIMESSR
jgi:hypothetical protein